MTELLLGALFGFFGGLIGMPMFLGFARMLGLYTTVMEGNAHVYVLFGNIIGVLDEPGLYILPTKLGPSAFIVNWLGRCSVIDMRLDQRYLRGQAVNSEEGAPMGIGVWYEMEVSDPVAFLFRNADPQGSLAANVSNAVVRTLSNQPLAEMLEDRHAMSLAVRTDVAPKSREWGYNLGSVYIRKVHFRDTQMTRQIEAKVVNRLRQVTSAISQDGANRVSVITSGAERQAAVAFAQAEAVRPLIVGKALNEITADAQVAEALFTILEYQKLIESGSEITLMPIGSPVLAKLLATRSTASR